MAHDDDDDYLIPTNWDDTETTVYEQLIGDEPEILEDSRLQMDFHGALFDRDLNAETRSYFYDDLIEYLWQEYGIDFELDFDWEAYRDWYETAA